MRDLLTTMSVNRVRTGRAAQQPGRSGRARIAVALTGLVIAGTGFSGIGTGYAGAAPPVTDGSDWGAQGVLSSDSAVTVRWDNQGNAPENTVPRNGQQVIPHTDNKTYDDVPARIADPYAANFGAGNGLGGLEVSVSQTRGLVNQAVTIGIRGAKGGINPDTQQFSTYFQIFQCWGGLTASGRPAPNASSPDPATCQIGEHGPDSLSVGGNVRSEERSVVGDPLTVSGGDWRQYSTQEGGAVPFTSIAGVEADGTKGQNKFFSKDTTNELSRVVAGSNGATSREFEVQTSLESAGLGCGKRSDAPSTSQCWIVVVPRVSGVLTTSTGPISPSLWAQRLQVRIALRDVLTGCPSGQSRSLLGGSEMLSNAAASWTPGVCSDRKIALGYTQLGDEVARNQFAAGSNRAILTTRRTSGVTKTTPVPLALSAPVFAYQLVYQPRCRWKASDTEETAKDCGYDSLAELRADADRAGTLIKGIKLDARLVAKLLTQSYQFAIFDRTGFSRLAAPWMTQRPTNLGNDPEFRRLNPDLRHLNLKDAASQAIDHLIVESLRSDGAAAVWDWLLADPDAKAFLNGCPDENGMVINPFYSTRTYEGCSDQKVALAAAAAAARTATPIANGYVDQPLSYPPDGSPFPLPTWQEARDDDLPTYGVVDHLPRMDSMAATGRGVGIGYAPANSQLCANTPQVPNDDCGPQPGKWTDPKTRQSASQVGLIAITDTATAARWRVPTAILCNTEGDKCVEANSASLRKAADRFSRDDDGWASPGPTDYASGAYPLTLPIYGAVDLTLPQSDRAGYADAFDYLIGKGQKLGFDEGNLPPGYAPLTDTLRQQAVTAIAQLRKAVPDTGANGDGGDGGGTNGGADGGAGGGGLGGGAAGGAASTPDAAGASPGAAASPGAQPTATAQVVTVAASTESWPGWMIPFGLLLALVAGLSGPVMSFTRNVRITR